MRSWLLVVAAFALALKAVDRLPAADRGHAARRAGLRVGGRRLNAPSARASGCPAFYPDTLAWPPARIDAWPGPPVVVALHVNGRADGRERLVIVQSFRSPAAPPPVLLPAPVQVLTTTDVRIEGRAGVLTRLVAPGGEVMHDVSWDHGTRRLTLRYHGPVEELLLIAASLERSQS